jgi:hypothetical protein
MSLQKRIEKLETQTGGSTDTPTRAEIEAELGRELTNAEATVLEGWQEKRVAIAEFDESPDEYKPLIEAWAAVGGGRVKMIYLPKVRDQD